MSSHTPGPWIYDPTNIGTEYSEGIGITTVASGHTLVHIPTGPDNGVAEANARLVAAAPDLLSIAKIVVPIVRDSCSRGASMPITYHRLLAAIRIAEGDFTP